MGEVAIIEDPMTSPITAKGFICPPIYLSVGYHKTLTFKFLPKI
jgi:hypothetical protein